MGFQGRRRTPRKGSGYYRRRSRAASRELTRRIEAENRAHPVTVTRLSPLQLRDYLMQRERDGGG